MKPQSTPRLHDEHNEIYLVSTCAEPAEALCLPCAIVADSQDVCPF